MCLEGAQARVAIAPWVNAGWQAGPTIDFRRRAAARPCAAPCALAAWRISFSEPLARSCPVQPSAHATTWKRAVGRRRLQVAGAWGWARCRPLFAETQARRPPIALPGAQHLPPACHAESRSELPLVCPLPARSRRLHGPAGLRKQAQGRPRAPIGHRTPPGLSPPPVPLAAARRRCLHPVPPPASLAFRRPHTCPAS